MNTLARRSIQTKKKLDLMERKTLMKINILVTDEYMGSGDIEV